MSIKAHVEVARQLLTHHPELSLPKDVLELKRLFAEQQTPNLKKVATLIYKDPMMTGDLIAIANKFSRLKGKTLQFKTLETALQFLGLKKINTYVLSVKLNQMYDRGFVKGMSYHSAMIAENMVHISQKIKTLREEDAYLLGLIHDIGLIVISSLDPQKCTTFVNELQKPYRTHQQEQEKYGTTHSALGYVIAEQWGLSPPLCKAILLHHELQIQKIKNTLDRDYTAALNLAHSLAVLLETPKLPKAVEVQHENAIKLLKLTEDDIEQLIEQAR